MSNSINAAGDSGISSTTAGDQLAPAITQLADGGCVVVWQSQQAPAGYSNPQFPAGFDLYMQRYDASGQSVGGETHVNSVAFNDQVQPVVAAAADGGFTVAWASAREHGMTGFDYGVYFQRFDADGNAIGGESQANSYYNLNQQHPSIAALADGFVVSWWSDVQSGNPPGLFMRRFDADGSALTSETRVGAGTAGPQSDAVVAALTGGGFVMAWDGATGIYSQRFDINGGPVGQQAHVDAGGANGLGQPAIAALDDGGYVVTWQAKDADGSGIFMQRFGADGAAYGAQSQVNSAAAGEQAQATITSLDDGGFAIAWTSPDAGGTGIFSQRFDASGHAVGGESQVDHSPGATVFDAAIAGDGHNGFFATWTSAGQDGSGNGVFATQVVAAPAAGAPGSTVISANNVDTGIVHASVLQVTSYSVDGSEVSISTGAGTQVFSNIERVRFDDALFALDTQGPSGHVWQAEALLWAALGSAPDVTTLSRWTAVADQSDDMAQVGQAIIDAYAPGISSADLVTHLYTTLIHEAPTADIVQAFVGQIGPGNTFETQGELYAFAATLPVNTDQFADIVGSLQPLDAGWFPA